MKNYTCTMTKRYTFTVSAENEEELYFWLQTHDFADVKGLTASYDVDYDEEILGETEEEAAFTI